MESKEGSIGGRCIILVAAMVAAICSEGLAFSARMAVAPHNVLELTEEAIQRAEKSLYINIYEMKSKEIVDAIVSQVEAGLHVEILQEGQPVGGIKSYERKLQQKIVDAMADANSRTLRGDHYYVMTSKAGRLHRRFRYDHAKYVVVDDESLLIGSENFSENAHPSASKPGNRGWETFLHEPTVARAFKKIFASDTDEDAGDVMDLVDSRGHQAPEWVPVLAPVMFPKVRMSLPDNTDLAIDAVEPIFSPHSLSGLLQLMNGAQRSLQLELMTFAPRWGKDGGASPLLSAVEAAARRGVKAQILLNDETAFSHQSGRDEKAGRPRKYGNVETCDELNQLAADESLELDCRIADLGQMQVAYIHNKGVLVDGDRVLVSSINWNQNSVENNREAGVVLKSEQAWKFYEPVFQQDWNVSESRRH